MSGSDKLRANWLNETNADRFGQDSPGFGAAMTAHGDAVNRGQPGYIDPLNGLFVMTAQYLRDRRWCCDCGCRHCPYDNL